MTTTVENPLNRLTRAQIDQIGEEFQAIHDDVYADLGERDATYIRSIIQFHRRLAAMGPPATRRPGCWAQRRLARPRSSRTWRSAIT
jgi:hypothetical protein